MWKEKGWTCGAKELLPDRRVRFFKKSFGSEGESKNITEKKPWRLSALPEPQLQDEGVVVPLHAGSAWRRAWPGGLHRPPPNLPSAVGRTASDSGGGASGRCRAGGGHDPHTAAAWGKVLSTNHPPWTRWSLCCM